MMKRFLFLINLIVFFIPNIYPRESAPSPYDGEHIVLQKRTRLTFANRVTKPNSTYEIRDVYDLNGKTITLPENCTLIFTGGELKNGTLVGNNTYLVGPAEQILGETIHFKDADKFHINGITFPKGKDISVIAQRMLDDFNILKLEIGTYYLSSPLIVKNHYAVIKGEGWGTVLTTDKTLDYAIRTVFDDEVTNPGKYYNVSFVEISDLKIEGRSSKFFKNGFFLDGPSCTVRNCYVNNIQSVGVKLCEWCNNLFNCIITRCDIGVLIMSNANAVNVCSNRIESNNVNLALKGYRGVNVSNNTLEGGALFNLVISTGYNCNIRDNYFEGYSSSVTDLLSTTELHPLEFLSSKVLRSFIWIGNIELQEVDEITNINYKVGKLNAPTTVNIEGNYVDIYSDKGVRDPTPYFVLIGSCLAHCSILNNTFTYPQNSVCAFFDIDNALLGNAEIRNNYVGGTAKTVNALELIHDNNNGVKKQNKNHFIGEPRLD